MSAEGGAAKEQLPLCLIVNVEIKSDQVEEFLPVIEADAVGSRKEPGCLRFDVIRDSSNPCKFVFYEVYTNMEALEFHKKQPHFEPWIKFKEAGGVVALSVVFGEGLYLP